MKKTIENTREEQEKAINGFTSKMDSNNISIKVEKIEKILEHRTRNLVVELKSELELATEFIIDAKSEDLKIDVEETAKTIEEKLGRGLNDRFDIRRDIEHDLHRKTEVKTKILIDEKIESKFLKNTKSIKYIEAKIDADRSKTKSEMTNLEKNLEAKLI